MKWTTVLWAALPLMVAATGSMVQAQGVGYSPGRALDAQSWTTFVRAVTPAGGGQLSFETWKTDAETYPTPPSAGLVAVRQLSRFQASVLGRFHLPAGLTAARQGLRSELPVPCEPAQPNPDMQPPPTPPPAASFPTPATATPPFGCVAEEVRRDPLSYNHIVSNHLNTQPGLIKAFKLAPAGSPATAIPPFPNNAIELKADWIPFTTIIQWLKNNNVTVTRDDVMKNYYHVNEQGTDYALVAVHISLKTREHPNWVWATFEHQWNPGRCDTMGCYDQYGIVPSDAAIPPASQQNTQYPVCTKSPALAAEMQKAQVSPVWNNYCLKETEVDFVSTQASTKGKPILDGNSVTERIAAGVSISSSSCIACHANASYPVVGTGSSARAAMNKAIGDAPIGAVTVLSPYMTYDFVWAIAAAYNAGPPE